MTPRNASGITALTCLLVGAVGAAIVHFPTSETATDEATIEAPVKERAFVCTDKYGTSQERFGISAAQLIDQVWHVRFADGQAGHYLQMHGEWCYFLPVDVKEEE